MTAFLLRRLAMALLVLLGLSVLVFALVRLVPGDTATALLGARYTEEDAARIRAEHGLDRPLVVQYGIWIGRLAQGDLGATTAGQSVATEIGQALPVTLQLVAMALLLAVGIGIPAGVVAAVRHNGPVDYAATVGSLVGISVPAFWLGAMLILVFALLLPWLPTGGFVPITTDPLENLRHMLLPGVSLGLAVAAVVMRMTRSSMLTVLHQDYVRTARAKGLPGRTVFFRHALKNAMVPVLTIVGIQVGYLLGGSIVIERVFSLNGVGSLLLRSVGERDYQLLQGVVLFIGAAFVMVNLAVDILYGVIDPRMRAGGGDA
jgi:peptide/nickel transport system permease protein